MVLQPLPQKGPMAGHGPRAWWHSCSGDSRRVASCVAMNQLLGTALPAPSALLPMELGPGLCPASAAPLISELSGQSAPCNFRSTTPLPPSCPAGAAFQARYNLRRQTQPGAAFQRGSCSSAAGRTGASPCCSPQSRGRRHHHGAALPSRAPTSRRGCPRS